MSLVSPNNSAFEEKQIATLIHGRYLLDRGSNPKPGRPLLVGFHGYAENAERHLEKQRQIPGASNWVLCSISGLHRFYHPKTQNILASWMTSQDRELMIDDNMRYAASVIAEVRRAEQTSDILVMSGFSQGVAMTYRAALRSGFLCHGLLALAGDVPPDIANSQTGPFPSVLLGRGTQDAWYTKEKMNADLKVLTDKGAQVESCVFEGGHDWTDEYFQAAGGFLSKIAKA